MSVFNHHCIGPCPGHCATFIDCCYCSDFQNTTFWNGSCTNCTDMEIISTSNDFHPGRDTDNSSHWGNIGVSVAISVAICLMLVICCCFCQCCAMGLCAMAPRIASATTRGVIPQRTATQTAGNVPPGVRT